MISEVFNRTIKIGDFVLFSTQKGDMSVANHGIIISQSSVFCSEDRTDNYCGRNVDKRFYSPAYVYKIDRMDEMQKSIYEKLVEDYNQFLLLKRLT